MFCSMNGLYRGLGISKLQFDQKILTAVHFFQFFQLNIKTLDQDWIRMGIQPKMRDPDPDSMNPDPKRC